MKENKTESKRKNEYSSDKEKNKSFFAKHKKIIAASIIVIIALVIAVLSTTVSLGDAQTQPDAVVTTATTTETTTTATSTSAPAIRCRCKNGGTCRSDGACVCPLKWTGTYCDEWRCPLGCLNRGTCVGPNECSCPLSKTYGKYCEGQCLPSCKNGGNCTANGCNCTEDRTGRKCREWNCQPPCENGGICNRNFKCECHPDTSGAHCQNPCPGDWHRANSKCYLKTGVSINWYDAIERCSRYSRAKLNEPLSVAEWNAITGYARYFYNWVGVRRRDGTLYYASDPPNREVTFDVPWLSGEPRSGGCVGYNRGWNGRGWFEESCLEKNYVVCEKDEYHG